MKKNKGNSKSIVKQVENAEVQNAEQVETAGKKVEALENVAENNVVLPQWNGHTYKASRLIFAKSIDEIDTQIKDDESVGIESLKQFVESFATARYTRVSKVRADVTAEEEDMENLSKCLNGYFKRCIMITIL